MEKCSHLVENANCQSNTFHDSTLVKCVYDKYLDVPEYIDYIINALFASI